MKRLLFVIPLLWQLGGLPALAAAVCTTAMPAHCCCCQHEGADGPEMTTAERGAASAVVPGCPCMAPATPDSTTTTVVTPTAPNRAPAFTTVTATLPPGPSHDTCFTPTTASVDASPSYLTAAPPRC